MKVTKGLIKEIIRMDNPTLQDVDVLWIFIIEGLHKQDSSDLFYEALKKYNQIVEA